MVFGFWVVYEFISNYFELFYLLFDEGDEIFDKVFVFVGLNGVVGDGVFIIFIKSIVLIDS